jgi:hypothetical protein
MRNFKLRFTCTLATVQGLRLARDGSDPEWDLMKAAEKALLRAIGKRPE